MKSVPLVGQNGPLTLDPGDSINSKKKCVLATETEHSERGGMHMVAVTKVAETIRHTVFLIVHSSFDASKCHE